MRSTWQAKQEGLSYIDRGFALSATAGLVKERVGRAGLPIRTTPSTAWAPAIRAGSIACYAVSVGGGHASCLSAGRQPDDATAVARGHRGLLGAPAMGYLHVSAVDARTTRAPTPLLHVPEHAPGQLGTTGRLRPTHCM